MDLRISAFKKPSLYIYDDITCSLDNIKKHKDKHNNNNINKLLSIIQFFNIIDIANLYELYGDINIIIISNNKEYYYNILLDLYINYPRIAWHIFNIVGFDRYLYEISNIFFYNIYKNYLTPMYYHLFTDKINILITDAHDLSLISNISPLYTLVDYKYDTPILGTRYLPVFHNENCYHCHMLIDNRNMFQSYIDNDYYDKMSYYNQIIKPSNDLNISGYILNTSNLYKGNELLYDVIASYYKKIKFSMCNL